MLRPVLVLGCIFAVCLQFSTVLPNQKSKEVRRTSHQPLVQNVPLTPLSSKKTRCDPGEAQRKSRTSRNYSGYNESVLLTGSPTNQWPPRKLFDFPQLPRSLSESQRSVAERLLQQEATDDIGLNQKDHSEYEDLLRMQVFLYETQNPCDCNKAFWTSYSSNECGGLGSQMRCFVNTFLGAVMLGNVFVAELKLTQVDPLRCPRQTWDCIFQSITHCDGAKAMSRERKRGAGWVSLGDWNPVGISDIAGLSAVYEPFWYFREAWRYVSRPGEDLKAMALKVKQEMGLTAEVASRGLGVHLRLAAEKNGERKRHDTATCHRHLNASEIVLETSKVVKAECARMPGQACSQIIVAGDLPSNVQRLSEELGPGYPVTSMNESYFLQSRVPEEQLAKADHFMLLKQRAASALRADEDLALVTQMLLLGSMQAMVGDVSSNFAGMACMYKSLGSVRTNAHSCLSFEPDFFLAHQYGYSRGWGPDPRAVRCNRKRAAQVMAKTDNPRTPSAPPRPAPAPGLDKGKGAVLQARVCMETWTLIPEKAAAWWRLGADPEVEAQMRLLLAPLRLGSTTMFAQAASPADVVPGVALVFAVARNPLLRAVDAYLDVKRGRTTLPLRSLGDAFSMGPASAEGFLGFLGSVCSEWSLHPHCRGRDYHSWDPSRMLPQVTCESEGGTLHLVLQLETLYRERTRLVSALGTPRSKSLAIMLRDWQPSKASLQLLQSLTPSQLQVLCELYAADLRRYKYACSAHNTTPTAPVDGF